MEVEVTEHAELTGGVEGPVGRRFGDGDDVDVVQHKLHTEQYQPKADAVQQVA